MPKRKHSKVVAERVASKHYESNFDNVLVGGNQIQQTSQNLKQHENIANNGNNSVISTKGGSIIQHPNETHPTISNQPRKVSDGITSTSNMDHTATSIYTNNTKTVVVNIRDAHLQKSTPSAGSAKEVGTVNGNKIMMVAEHIEQQESDGDDNDDESFYAALPQFHIHRDVVETVEVPGGSKMRSHHLATPTNSQRDRDNTNLVRVPSECTSSLTSTHNSTNQIRSDQYCQEWRPQQGNFVTMDEQERTVTKYVRDTLFARVKFINTDQELNHTGKSKEIMT